MPKHNHKEAAHRDDTLHKIKLYPKLSLNV